MIKGSYLELVKIERFSFHESFTNFVCPSRCSLCYCNLLLYNFNSIEFLISIVYLEVNKLKLSRRGSRILDTLLKGIEACGD